MRLRQLEKLIAQLSHRSETDLDQRGRRLRAALMIPTGGRGPNAPSATPSLAATVLIGAASTALAIDVVQGVTEFATMVPLGKSFCAADTFGEAIETALTKYELAKAISRVELMRFGEGNPDSIALTSVMASITWEEAGETVMGVYVPEAVVKKFKKGNPSAIGAGMMFPTTVIGGGLIAFIAMKLAEDEGASRAGWSGRSA